MVWFCLVWCSICFVLLGSVLIVIVGFGLVWFVWFCWFALGVGFDSVLFFARKGDERMSFIYRQENKNQDNDAAPRGGWEGGRGGKNH